MQAGLQIPYCCRPATAVCMYGGMFRAGEAFTGPEISFITQINRALHTVHIVVACIHIIHPSITTICTTLPCLHVILVACLIN
jgi:hypothetical protein